MVVVDNTMKTVITYPQGHRVANAELWNISSPQWLKVIRHTYFATPVTETSKFDIIST